MRVFTSKEQAKTWKTGPEAAKRGNERFTSGSLHENHSFEAASQTWNLAAKPSNLELKDL